MRCALMAPPLSWGQIQAKVSLLRHTRCHASSLQLLLHLHFEQALRPPQHVMGHSVDSASRILITHVAGFPAT